MTEAQFRKLVRNIINEYVANTDSDPHKEVHADPTGKAWDVGLDEVDGPDDDDGPNLPGFDPNNPNLFTLTVNKHYAFAVDPEDAPKGVHIIVNQRGDFDVTGTMNDLESYIDGITIGDYDSREEMWATIRPA
jgi:hypothetical protein